MKTSLKILLLFTGIIVPLLMLIIVSIFKRTYDYATLSTCKGNLVQIGKGMNLYVDNYGRNVYFPRTNGSLFLTKLYTTTIISDPQVFLCPGTNDSNGNGRLLLTLQAGDPQNNCSYAGRKNFTQFYYPGIYGHNKSFTPIASDDIEQPSGTNNHFYTINMLEYWGSVGEYDYTNGSVTNPDGRTCIRDGEKLAYWMDPLTN